MNQSTEYNIGLALGGGGARGFAHLGVLQAMYELGLKPDIISGTSAGAIVGAMIASGHTPEECMNFFSKKRLLHFARPTMSKKGFMTMSALEEQLEEFIPARTFNDLKIPLVITASNIKNAKAVHFESGELLPCIIASCSIPVVFTPKEIDEVDYVDGGIFMNLPVRPIRERCKRVIAVEINSINTSDKVTNILTMATRSFYLGLNQNICIDKKMSDVFIEPKYMTKYSIFDIENMSDVYSEGYTTAKKLLQKKNIKGLFVK